MTAKEIIAEMYKRFGDRLSPQAIDEFARDMAAPQAAAPPTSGAKLREVLEEGVRVFQAFRAKDYPATVAWREKAKEALSAPQAAAPPEQIIEIDEDGKVHGDISGLVSARAALPSDGGGAGLSVRDAITIVMRHRDGDKANYHAIIHDLDALNAQTPSHALSLEREKRVRELIAKWRKEAAQAKQLLSNFQQAAALGVEQCANELEQTLVSNPSSEPAGKETK
jgi:hypothetical protein